MSEYPALMHTAIDATEPDAGPFCLLVSDG
jgi:hypothetical protein